MLGTRLRQGWGQELGLALAPVPQERDRVTQEKLGGERTGRMCSTCWVRYSDVLAGSPDCFGIIFRRLMVRKRVHYRSIRAAVADALSRGSTESWRAEHMYNSYSNRSIPYEPSHSTPFVLPTSPSLPSILAQAILHAPASALNALSALW